jgi:hydroxymethylbilane synthase
LQHHHPTVTAQDIRGNVDSRLRKFAEGSMAGMILASAGLDRLGLAGHITERLDPAMFLPAPGQGALAIEGRDDALGEALLAPLDDADTRDRVIAERSMLAELEGGCQVPVAAFAQLAGDELRLDGLVASLDGREAVRGSTRGRRGAAQELGRELAQDLRERGAGRILEAIRRSGGFAS